MHTHTCTRAYTHTLEYYSAIKNNEILPFATTWIDLGSILLNEISQTSTTISLICGIKNQNKQTKQKKTQTHRCKEEIGAYQGEECGSWGETRSYRAGGGGAVVQPALLLSPPPPSGALCDQVTAL